MQQGTNLLQRLLVTCCCALLLSGCGAAANWESGGSQVTPLPTATRSASRRAAPRTAATKVTRKTEKVRANSGYHAVSDGDTLYSIAWRYQLDYRDLARWNGRENSSLIYSGERLRLTPPAGSKEPSQPAAPNRSIARSERPSGVGGNQNPVVKKTKKNNGLAVGQSGKTAADILWRWPANGTVSSVSYGPQSKLKGLLISGETGEPIYAAAAGTVVYIGSGLPRYGRIVIVKHSENIFSAYAHLQTIGVQQGQWIAAGSPLATMGSIDGSGETALRFDIRDGADSLSPLQLLPAKPSASALR